MLITTTMSDYEDDLDDDLPSVSLTLSQSCEKSALEMPSASEVASQRAREEAVERALHDLGQGDVVLPLVSLARSASQGSSGEEGEVNSFFMAHEDTDLLAALSAAVSALQVEEPQPKGRDILAQRSELMTAMRDRLPADDAQFVDAYIRVLKDRPESADSVTEKILGTISCTLINGWAASGATCVSGACAWLLGVSLTLTTARALRVRRALHALLDNYASSDDVEVMMRACGALQDGADQLVCAHDAVRTGAGRGADLLANTLLARAMAAILQTDQDIKPIDADPPAPLSIENITSIRSSWRKMCPRSQLTLLRCAGRALAARGERGGGGGGDGGEGEGEGEGGGALLDALAQPLPRASAFHEDRQQVLTNVSKLQLLFRSRFSPVPDILNSSQGSITELTDTPTDDTLTGETMTDDTAVTRETTKAGETVITLETSASSASKDSLASRDSSMSLDNMELLEPIIEITITAEKLQQDTTNEARNTSKDTPKKKTQTKLDRFLKKETPKAETRKETERTEVDNKKETERTEVENKKEIEDYERSPERKRSRRDTRRDRKGQKK